MKLIQSFPPCKLEWENFLIHLNIFLTIKVPIKRKLLNCLQECIPVRSFEKANMVTK